MSFKYISSSIVLSLLLTSCSSHTDKIKRQLGKDFNQQIYVQSGGEKDSKHRTEVFTKAICDKRYTKEQLQNLAINKFYKDDDQLKLVNAEIVLASKNCKN